MENTKRLEDYIRLSTGIEDLEIYVKDLDVSRKILIKGNHVIPGGLQQCLYSELETQLSLPTLTKMALKKGRYFRDEIERSENPNYLQRKIEILVREFGIVLSHKKLLDFGCGAGASTLIFLRCGATDVTGVEVDDSLLDIARLRLNDFFQGSYQLTKIEYIDGQYSTPFSDGAFDIVWAQAIMEHVLPIQRKLVLRELWRVLRQDGLLVIFGTPNRLWFKEFHTSNLFFVNYLPLDIAVFLARHCSRRVRVDQSKQELLSGGFRGCTYWEIARALPNAVCLSNVLRRKDLSVGLQAWRGDTDSKLRKWMIQIFGLMMRVPDPVFSFFNVPQTAFLPSHILVFQKS
ncbi:MAG TPA: class I SAM-dependent methyltransferase [Thermodesulfobacteriota bacterium]|nr:class I SAM-dependent methyltransferase [Thermodesulfobacteriota bacterium]